MKTLSWLACSLTLASALACCSYDNRPYGHTHASYRSSAHRTTYPGTYTSDRYVVPTRTQTVVSGYPPDRYMSVGGYGYVPPAPRTAPWPLR
jgi:hypothetical protein